MSKAPKRLMVLWALMGIAVLISLGVGLKRNYTEYQHTGVATVLGWSDIQLIAHNSGISDERALRDLKSAGLSAVAVASLSVANLQALGQVSVTSGRSLISEAQLSPGAAPLVTRLVSQHRILPQRTYVFVTSPGLLARIQQATRIELGGKYRLRVLAHRPVLAVTHAPIPVISQVEIGPYAPQVHAVQRAGLGLILRYDNALPGTAAVVRYLMSSLPRLHPEAVIFSGSSVLGYPANLPLEAQLLHGVPVGVIEFTKQAGILGLSYLLNDHMVRVFDLGVAEMALKGFRGTVSSDMLAVRERDVRVLYLHAMYAPAPTATPLGVNEAYLAKLRSRIAQEGFHVGVPRPFGPFHVPEVLLILMGLGATAAALLVIEWLWPGMSGRWPILWALAFLFTLALWPHGDADRARRLTALAAAVSFPSLAMTRPWLGRIGKSTRYGHVMGMFFGMTAITVMGASVSQALLSANRYFLALDIFFGVKLVFVLPILVLALAFFLQQYAGRVGQALRNFWRTPLRLNHVVVAVVVGVIALVYITRTGNTPPIGVTSLETQMRGLLTHYLEIRPRTKEFLIGNPAMIVGLAFLIRGRRWPAIALMLLGATGQVDMVDTFAHLETPVTVSLIRLIYGLIIGGVLGSIVLVALRPVWRRTAPKPEATAGS